MNYATERLLAAANASLTAWEGEEESVREEHRDQIEELESAIHYFDAHGAKDELQLTTTEAEQIAWAVQWAGHFATLAGDCQPGGPAFSNIALATAALERCGFKVYHSGTTRAAVEATAALIERRRKKAAARQLASDEAAA